MSDFRGKNVFITGADGFIGSHLTEALVRSGARVKAMSLYNSFGSWGNLEHLPKDVLSQIEVFQGDVTDPFSVKKGVAGSDAVFHLASLIAIPYSYVAPQSYVSTNVMGTLNVMQACLESGVSKVVHTSTSETYGTAQYVPIDEKHPMQGQSPYSASKIGADKIAESYFLSFGLPVATIRPFNTYGPRQSARAIIPTVISQVLAGKTTLSLGSLDPVRDFTFVLDTVEGFLSVARSEKATGTVVNVGQGSGVTIGETVQMIVDLMGRKVAIEEDKARVRPDKSEVMRLICDNKKAVELCGWKPKTSLKDGLLQTIAYIEKNLASYKPEIYNV
jgi:NAD dependent epimerase/dehydratase